MLSREADAVLARLEDAGHAAYAVGGCVRDLLRGAVPHDWDVTTSARPEEVMALFPGRCIPTGLPHGTITVRENHQSIEVTTFRADGPYDDGRHPRSVTFSTRIEDDLARRDFTVNAMALDRRGTLVDVFGGREDLARGVIRCVGEPDRRFGEDALRVMRALRFAACFGFSIGEETARGLRRSAPGLRRIAAERLREEMTKLLCGDGAAAVLLAYPEVIGVFLPEILPSVGFEQHNPHHCYTVWEHLVRSAAAVPPEPVLRWAMLLHDIGKPACFTRDAAGVGHFYDHAEKSAQMVRGILRCLRFDRRSAERIELLVRIHDRDLVCTRRSVTRALGKLGPEVLAQLLAVKRADNFAQAPACHGRQRELDDVERLMQEILAENPCFSLAQLAANGRDMTALGLTGPAVGKMLRRLLSEVMSGKLENDRETLLRRAQQLTEK